MSDQVENLSALLYGRNDSAKIFCAIANLEKPEFENKHVIRVTGVDDSAVSREIKRLISLRMVDRIGRQGRFRRRESAFWQLVVVVVDEWEEHDA